MLMAGCAGSSTHVEVATSVTHPVVSRSAEQAVTNGAPIDEQPITPAVAQDSSNTPDANSKELSAVMPTACGNHKDCVPPEPFARAACRGRFPSMALAMFERHTPWQRLYLKAVTLEAVNAYGERSSTTLMVFGEEVIVLRSSSSIGSGNMRMSSTDIDVLRWDGTCATVARELFSATPMPKRLQSVEWRYLEDAYQEALLKSKYVALSYDRKRTACKGPSEEKCRNATERLNEAIGVAIRDGIALPAPSKLPKWAVPEPSHDGEFAVANARSR